jgi:lipopolysaccharide/colanic/teichoic acid biosynthesis glycosyltransferase
VISESLFRGVLIRERKRSDRSSQPFVLLLLTARDVNAAASLPWTAVAGAATAAKRDTDVVGWFNGGSALGVILPEIIAPEIVVPELEARIRRELSRRLEPAMAAQLLIQVHAHVPSASIEPTGFERVDPLLGAMGPGEGQIETYDIVKRLLDVAGSLALLIVLAPLLLLISALVKLTSRGPVFFKQSRVGLNARPFTMLKFRTMRVNVDHGVHQQYVSWFINSSGRTTETENDNGLFKITNDPRVTAVGRILRKTSFDELPQLLNVLRGEMSLVGPRPPLHYEVEEYKPWHRRRVLEAKPGITGLWQVTGRSRTTFDEMVRLDLRYARTRSLWTDIKILLATPAAVISGKGAC